MIKVILKQYYFLKLSIRKCRKQKSSVRVFLFVGMDFGGVDPDFLRLLALFLSFLEEKKQFHQIGMVLLGWLGKGFAVDQRIL